MDQEELGNTDLEINVIEEYADVIYTLESEEFDLLHISTHAKYEGHNTSPAFSTVKLKGNDELRPEDIKGKATSFGRFKPFVILNACQTGAQGYSFTRVEGWPRRFIVDSRSSVFIGTLWQATDKAATKFTKALYNELRKGTVLGEAVRLARINCKERGDPSWLAYQLYGHPNVQINIGQGGRLTLIFKSINVSKNSLLIKKYLYLWLTFLLMFISAIETFAHRKTDYQLVNKKY